MPIGADDLLTFVGVTRLEVCTAGGTSLRRCGGQRQALSAGVIAIEKQEGTGMKVEMLACQRTGPTHHSRKCTSEPFPLHDEQLGKVLWE